MAHDIGSIPMHLALLAAVGAPGALGALRLGGGHSSGGLLLRLALHRRPQSGLLRLEVRWRQSCHGRVWILVSGL